MKYNVAFSLSSAVEMFRIISKFIVNNLKEKKIGRYTFHTNRPYSKVKKSTRAKVAVIFSLPI
jgi:hypothetical protein